MSEHYNHWPVAVICEALEVSRSGYYDYMKTQTTDASTDDLELLTRVKAIHAETGSVMAVVAWRKRFKMRVMK